MESCLSSIKFTEITRFRKLWQTKIEIGSYKDRKCIKDVRDRKILHTEFLKVQYIIIQAVLSGKSIKKIAVTDEKIFHV